MLVVSSGPPPTPERLFAEIGAYWRSASLRAATDLDLFTAVGEGIDTPQALAKRCEASERGVRILSDYLVTIGFLTKSEGKYALTSESAAFLDRRSPMYLGSISRLMAGPTQFDFARNLTASVRKGGTVVGEEGMLTPENPEWVEFARSAAPMAAMSSKLIADRLAERGLAPTKILDVAAGHGLFGIALALRNPKAEVVASDWANVLEVARENATKAGVADRYRTAPGSAFEVDFGTGFDLVLLTNFLHHFDETSCTNFLRKVRAALKEGGWAVALEFVPNDDRVTPTMAAQFAIIMLGATRAGDAYTFPDLARMFRAAGFRRSEIESLLPSPQQVVWAQR